MESFSINKLLIWDYDFKDGCDTEEFRIWYVSRVLCHGTKKDIRSLGMDTIRHYFPRLNLPAGIRKFWTWYFDYAHID